MVEAGKDQFMKKLILVMALGGLALSAHATEYAKVISSTPVLGEVTVPQRSCWNEQETVAQPRTGVGATIGAVAGGLLGSTMGRGAGKAAATAAGVITGAVVGDKVERDSADNSTQTVQKCQTTQVTTQQTIGYDVVYEYGGRRYTARLARDPGDRMPINVAVSPSDAAAPAATTTTTVVQTSPTVVYRSAPVYVDPTPPVVVDWWWWGGPGPGPHHGPHRW